MSRVFLDTVGLLALWDSSDQWHAVASNAYAILLADGAELLTTSAILLECGNAAARRPYRLAVDRLKSVLEAEGLIIHPTDDDWRIAWECYRNGEAAGAGIVDHLSFAAMTRVGVARAFTNDRHFLAAGFEVLF